MNNNDGLTEQWTREDVDNLVKDQVERGYEFRFNAQAIKNSDVITVNGMLMESDVAKHFYTVINRHRPDRNSYYNNRLPAKPKSDHDKEFHKKYVTTKEWKAKRKAVFERDNHRCVKCGSSKRLCCHHLTYDNLGNEPLCDLQALCASCHASLHWLEAIGEPRESGGF